jgi:hypothetical protein
VRVGAYLRASAVLDSLLGNNCCTALDAYLWPKAAALFDENERRLIDSHLTRACQLADQVLDKAQSNTRVQGAGARHHSEPPLCPDNSLIQ